MASNKLPDPLDDLFSLADDCVDGAHQYEATLPLKQNTEVAIATDLGDARADETAYKNLNTGLSAAQTAVRVADSNVKTFLAKAKKAIASVKGDDWSPLWSELGFPSGSLALPTTQSGRFDMIQKMPGFLTAHADCVDSRPAVNVTAAAATTLYTALGSARGASNQAETDYNEAKNTRDGTVQRLRTRLSGLIGELGQLIPDDSPVWYAFGLNAPADPATPGAPLTDPTVTPGAPGTLYSVWGISRRGNGYHVYVQIIGTDPEPRRVATVQDRAYTFTGLPTGQTAKVSIAGYNDAGEGPQSAQVEAVLP
jgi:hypothetical protein